MVKNAFTGMSEVVNVVKERHDNQVTAHFVDSFWPAAAVTRRTTSEAAALSSAQTDQPTIHTSSSNFEAAVLLDTTS